ncbi:MAG: 4-hydroxy-3-methylbut-2-enyl diphosphate reductase [Bacteroidetes bacterium]|nr:4-hydroxy-3-methylbut-2-enyl diphosphate reductase [Bacteroidota bacterium]
MNVTIDKYSGFCFGVIHAIEVAERKLEEHSQLYCLGDIVHNGMEVKRLVDKGLKIITHEEFKQLHNCNVLIRAHGEPPETYKTALENNINLIDASCPIVLKLQSKIRKGYEEMLQKNGQIVIYGKLGHAEVNGLVGQTDNTAIVVDNDEDIEQINFSRPLRLYSQTTKSIDGLARIIEKINTKIKEVNNDKEIDFVSNDTICRQVSNRSSQLKEFSNNFEVIIFVSGKKSSNGMFLFDLCKSVNPHTYMVAEPAEINKDWFKCVENVGVCGATSTPMWLMEEIAGIIREF